MSRAQGPRAPCPLARVHHACRERAAQGEVGKTVKLCVAVGAARRARSQVQRAAQHRWLQREAGMRKESRPVPSCIRELFPP